MIAIRTRVLSWIARAILIYTVSVHVLIILLYGKSLHVAYLIAFGVDTIGTIVVLAIRPTGTGLAGVVLVRVTWAVVSLTLLAKLIEIYRGLVHYDIPSLVIEAIVSSLLLIWLTRSLSRSSTGDGESPGPGEGT